jgi:hypothetical protein
MRRWKLTTTICLLASVTALAACTPKWQKAGVSPEQLAKDDYECVRETQQMNWAARLGWGGYNAPARAYYQRCMKARGYTAE